MALITCPECGKTNLSDKAKTCPECGYVIKRKINEIKKKQIIRIAIILIIGIIAITTAVLIPVIQERIQQANIEKCIEITKNNLDFKHEIETIGYYKEKGYYVIYVKDKRKKHSTTLDRYIYDIKTNTFVGFDIYNKMSDYSENEMELIRTIFEHQGEIEKIYYND